MTTIPRLPKALAFVAGAVLAGQGLPSVRADPPPTPSAPVGEALPPRTPDPNPPTVPASDDVVEAKPRTDLPRQRVVLFGEAFEAELCLEEETRALGMGGRDAFPEGTAMIFVHPRPRVLNYWMKDCLIDMDMIFVDAAGKIASFHEAKRERLRKRSETAAAYEARLPRYGPARQVQFVIELPPGSIRRLKPSVGQTIALDWPALVRRAH